MDVVLPGHVRALRCEASTAVPMCAVAARLSKEDLGSRRKAGTWESRDLNNSWPLPSKESYLFKAFGRKDPIHNCNKAFGPF